MASQGAAGSATIRGTVVDEAGRPIEAATALVYSAQLKTGYAIVCPTCWLDCGKRTETDAAGEFTITDLNPQLSFRLLFLKQGFAATARDGVDPSRGPLTAPVTLIGRAASAQPTMLVQGRLTDTAGIPVVGALIEPIAATTSAGHTMYGQIPGMDRLAATDGAGRFEMVVSEPVQSVTLKISPRALAAKFISTRPGADPMTVVLTEGATVIGRLIDPHGKPVANAQVVMTSHSRMVGESLDDLRVGTDQDGSFTFTNAAAPGIWGLFPAPDSLRGRSLTAGPRWLETRGDRQILDLGKIRLQSGYTVRGRVVLPDGQTIPAGTHATLKPDWTIYDRISDIAADGSFAFTAVAPDVYALNAGIRGYMASADSPQNILVDGNRGDVVIHMVKSP